MGKVIMELNRNFLVECNFLCYFKKLSRKKRYLSMFRDLGNGVILGDQKVVFKDAVNWAIEYLRKDDRVVWYLSMVQRLALIENRSNPLFHSPKWRKKVKRKLDGWSGGRVMDDFNLFTQQVWEHFYGVQEVYSHPSMKDYPFYACGIGHFGKTFSKGFHQSSNYVKGKGNLKKIPNLKPLKTNMIKYMEDNSPISYIHSHEILFGKNINLKKYCLCIIIRTNKESVEKGDYIKYEKMASKLGIPIKYELYHQGKDKFKYYSINKFVDLIEH